MLEKASIKFVSSIFSFKRHGTRIKIIHSFKKHVTHNVYIMSNTALKMIECTRGERHQHSILLFAADLCISHDVSEFRIQGDPFVEMRKIFVVIKISVRIQ